MKRIISALIALVLSSAAYGEFTAITPNYLTGTPLESFGMSPNATATVNAAALQSGFNKGGLLTLTTCGTYQVNATSKIGNNTDLEVSPCVTVQRVANNINMIETTAYSAATTSITLSAAKTSTVTISNASPAVITWNNHGLVANQAISFSTTGGLPTGLATTTVYYVSATNLTTNTFQVSTVPGGTSVNTSSAGSGTQTATQNDNTVKVTWTGHGFSVGTPVNIQGANQSYYNGTWLVQTVVDANTFIFQTIRKPAAAPTGTILGRASNYNITINGGNWDFNFPTFTQTPLKDSVALIGYAYNVNVRNMHILNGGTYGIDSGALRDAHFANMTETTGQEIVKVYGPAYGVTVEHLYGNTTDDATSFQTTENVAVFPLYIWTAGDVIGVRAHDIYVDAGSSSGSVTNAYFSPNEYMDQVHIDGVYGSAQGSPSGLVQITGINATDRAGLIDVQNIHGFTNYSAIRTGVGIIQRLTVKNLELNGTIVNSYPTSRSSISVSSSTQINKLTVDGFSYQNAATGLLAGTVFTLVECDGCAIGEAHFSNITMLDSTVFMRLITINAGSSIGTVDVDACAINSVDELVVFQNSVGTIFGSFPPQVNFRGGMLSGDSLLYADVTVNVNIIGVTMPAIVNGVVSSGANTGIINTTQSGNTLTSGAWTHVWGNTPTFNFLGGAKSQSVVASPTAPNSTSAFTMQGLAGTITPIKTGNVLVTISGTVIATGTTVNQGVIYQISHGTGTAPTTNAALTGTQDCTTQEYTHSVAPTAAADVHYPFSISCVVSGLTLGTAYWLDLAAKSITTASAVAFSAVSISTVEP